MKSLVWLFGFLLALPLAAANQDEDLEKIGVELDRIDDELRLSPYLDKERKPPSDQLLLGWVDWTIETFLAVEKRIPRYSEGDDLFADPAEKLTKLDFSMLLADLLQEWVARKEEMALPELKQAYHKHQLDSRPDSEIIEPFALALANAQLLAAIGERGVFKEAVPPLADPPPDFLAGASDDLRLAHAFSEEFTNEFRDLIHRPSPDGVEPSQFAHDPEFHFLIAHAIATDDWSKAGEMPSYTWGFWCGNGSEGFTSQKIRFIGLTKMEEGQPQQALLPVIWYLLEGVADDGLIYSPIENDHPKLLIDRLKRGGASWEEAAIGWLISQEAFPRAYVIAQHGSAKSVRILSEAALIESPPDSWNIDNLLETLYKFAMRDQRRNQRVFPKPPLLRLLPKQRRRMLDGLAAASRHCESPRTLERVVEFFEKIQEPGSEEALHELTKSVYPNIAASAAAALKARGIDEKFELATEQTLAAQLLIDGVPLANHEVGAGQPFKLRGREAWISRGYVRESRLETDDAGWLRVLRFKQSYASDERAWLMIQATPKGEGPVFAVERSIADLAKTPKLEIQTQQLLIDLGIPRERLEAARNEPVVIELTPKPGGTRLHSFDGCLRELPKPGSGRPLTLRVGPGLYGVRVQVGGCAIWEGEPIQIGRSDIQLVVELKPGISVRYELDPPTPNHEVRILRVDVEGKYGFKFMEPLAGERVDYLVPGRYQLTIAHEPHGQSAAELEFAIDSTDSPVIDLGTIPVGPPPPPREAEAAPFGDFFAP
ncbi:MAG: hypothetical protein ACI8UO_000149 [Verrucomicrobiales bacterium]|jgi:hypothetical protein